MRLRARRQNIAQSAATQILQSAQILEALQRIQTTYDRQTAVLDRIACTLAPTTEQEREAPLSETLSTLNRGLVEALCVAERYLSKRVVGSKGQGETQVLPIMRAALAACQPLTTSGTVKMGANSGLTTLNYRSSSEAES